VNCADEDMIEGEMIEMVDYDVRDKCMRRR
jgi:hypothetical protein